MQSIINQQEVIFKRNLPNHILYIDIHVDFLYTDLRKTYGTNVTRS